MFSLGVVCINSFEVFCAFLLEILHQGKMYVSHKKIHKRNDKLSIIVCVHVLVARDDIVAVLSVQLAFVDYIFVI